MREEELRGIATDFRCAIDEAVRAGALREMQNFPTGCCSFASDLLQCYLIEQYEFFTWYMSGEYGYGEDGESHSWLETIDHSMVIDITGDQYKYNKRLRFTEPVYIGPREDGFHDKFELHKPVPYQIDNDPFGVNRDKKRRFEAVVKYLASQIK